MSTRPRTVTGLSEALQRFDLLVASLTPEQWAAPSLCPDWTVRDVVAHVGSMEQELLAWRGADPPLLARLAHAIDDWRSAPPEDLSGRLRDVVHARVTELAAMTDDDFEAVGDMPTGRSSYGRFMEARTFDVWIHERDISVPLRLVGQDGGQPAEMALEEVRRALGYVVGKKIGLDDGAGIAFQLTGALEARLNVMVDGRAVVVDELADPRCTVTADFLAFMLLACGRIDPEVAIADGRISWSGDDAIGGVAARQLRFTT